MAYWPVSMATQHNNALWANGTPSFLQLRDGELVSLVSVPKFVMWIANTPLFNAVPVEQDLLCLGRSIHHHL